MSGTKSQIEQHIMGVDMKLDTGFQVNPLPIKLSRKLNNVKFKKVKLEIYKQNCIRLFY